MAATIVRAEFLSCEAFAPFGDVIESDGRNSRWINDDTCRRFDGFADIDVAQDNGRPVLSIFEANARSLPLKVRALERHPLSSQAFFPLSTQPFLIVVAEVGASPLAARLRAYLSSGRQGVNYRRNTWHYPLIALEQHARFLVIDRGGAGENCEEHALDAEVLVELP